MIVLIVHMYSGSDVISLPPVDLNLARFCNFVYVILKLGA